MSDEIEDKKPTEEPVEPVSKYAHLSPMQADKAEKAAAAIALTKKLREISGDGKWTITQRLMQDVLARRIIADPNAPFPKTPQLITELHQAIDEAYKNQPEMIEFLKETIPTIDRVRAWLKKDGWEEAVWAKIKDTGLFTKERRAVMINALYQRGVEKDTVAAKIWLQMSGDFVEKSEVTNKDNTVDKFREINSIIHSKKKDNG